MEIDTINPDLLAVLTPGARLRYKHGAANELRHIRAIVDDEYVVYKVWWPPRWEYEIVSIYSLNLEWEQGWLRPA